MFRSMLPLILFLMGIITGKIAADSLFSAGTNLLGGLFGAKSASDANKTNLQIARETNKANLDLAKLQNDWNVDMWNRTNEYNSPAAQRERLLQAGINPLGHNFTDGNASSLESANLANQNPAQVDPTAVGNALQSGINNAVNSYLQSQHLAYQNELLKTQIEGQKIDNHYKPFQNNLDFERNMADNANKWADTDFQRDSYRDRLNLIAEQFQTQVFETIKKRFEAEYTAENIGKLKYDRDLTRKMVDWYDRLSEAEIFAKRAGGSWSLAQVERMAQLLPYEVLAQKGSLHQIEQTVNGIILDNLSKGLSIDVQKLETYFMRTWGLDPKSAAGAAAMGISGFLGYGMDKINDKKGGYSLNRQVDTHFSNDKLTSHYNYPAFMKLRFKGNDWVYE